MALPHPLPIGRGRRGKPFLAAGQGPFDFNLSHTGELALLAVSRHGSVGIDVERVRPVRDPLRIATRVWPDDLVARLASRPDNDRLRAFFLGWTRFEACQKAVGRGVFDPPVDPSGLQTSSFSPAPGYVACLAVVAAGYPPLHFFDFMPQ